MDRIKKGLADGKFRGRNVRKGFVGAKQKRGSCQVETWGHLQRGAPAWSRKGRTGRSTKKEKLAEPQVRVRLVNVKGLLDGGKTKEGYREKTIRAGGWPPMKHTKDQEGKKKNAIKGDLHKIADNAHTQGTKGAIIATQGGKSLKDKSARRCKGKDD